MDNLNYHFSSPHDEPDIDFSNYQQFTIDKGINSSQSVQFLVEGHEESLIDLSQTFLKTTFRIVKDDGSTLPATASVFPTESYGVSLWSQASVSLNNAPLAPTNDYPYTGHVMELVGASPEARGMVQKTIGGFQMPNYKGSQIKFALKGSYLAAKNTFKQSKPVTIYNRIYSDFMTSCSQYLPNKMQLGITLTRSKDAFVLGTDGNSAAFKIDIMAVSLYVKRVYLNKPARLMLESSLSNGGKLQYQRLQTVVYPCAKGSQSWNWHNCFSGLVPRRVFLVLVSQEAYYGSLKRTSMYLESGGVSSVRFCVDGREVMAEPYSSSFSYDADGKVDTDKSNATSAYAGFTRTIGCFSAPRDYMGVEYKNYIDGSTIFGVALDHAASPRPIPGSFDAHIDFSVPTTEAYMVIMVGEYPKTIAFDQNRNLIY